MSKRLLSSVPSGADLERLYWELSAIGAPVVGRKRPWRYKPCGEEALLALACDMLRYDARLLSVLLQLFLSRWQELNPLALRRRMAEMSCAQALLVVLGFARLAGRDEEFLWFVDYVSAGWPRVDPAERFFLDAARPGSRTAARSLGRNLAPYARWGFVGTERPVADMAKRRALGRYDPRTRRRILLELAERALTFALADYLDAVDHAITRQQALTDLRSCPGIALAGHGRGAVWRSSERRSRQRSAKARDPRQHDTSPTPS